MSEIGLFALLIAFVASSLSVVALAVGHALRKKQLGATLSWAGRVAAVLAFIALTVCCGVLIYCFATNNYSIQYVLDEHSSSNNVFYKISALWAGREGSLLFWTWLISLINSIVALRKLDEINPLDNIAVLVSELVLASFVGVMLFSEANMPFSVTEARYFSNGVLTAAGSLLGMNTLLEHWAMAIHPPTLFVGYAGLTIPFAYGIAALVTNNSSTEWVHRSERFALVAWFMLTVGIGLGSVWAYTVLGWGGFWGWDPVENASLLPWLVCVALIHSLSQYKRRGVFKRWSVMCACLAFAFCIVGTFISRSGIVQSVHAFEGDPVSLVLFGALIALSILAGAVGCLLRGKTFTDSTEAEAESMVSREGAFYVNNLLMIVLTLLITYMTVAQALPSWLPLGGQSVGSGSYEAIARPIGIVYLLLLAVCPLLAWSKTNPRTFFKNAKIPGLCALVCFVVLLVYATTTLFPRYDAIIAAGGSSASALSSYGPRIYYFILTIVGFLVASLLLFNSLFQLVRMVRTHGGKFLGKLPAIGSSISHAAMGLILAGLIGSMMFVTNITGYVDYNSETDTAGERFTILDYELEYTQSSIVQSETTNDVLYTVEFDVYKDGNMIGHVTPSVTWVANTQQQKLNASVISLPTEDLFVVYRGVSAQTGALSMDVRVNPLVSCVWAGFFLLCLGMLVSACGRRSGSSKAACVEGKVAEATEAAVPAEATTDAADTAPAGTTAPTETKA